jgi:hypothetical protein
MGLRFQHAQRPHRAIGALPGAAELVRCGRAHPTAKPLDRPAEPQPRLSSDDNRRPPRLVSPKGQLGCPSATRPELLHKPRRDQAPLGFLAASHDTTKGSRSCGHFSPGACACGCCWP